MSFLKRLWHRFNYLGEPGRYNRGEYDYGYKYFTEFLFDFDVNLILLLAIQIMSFIPLVGLVVPVGNLVGAVPDDEYNINQVSLRFVLISGFISIVSTLLWIV